jgi:predicted integral membrane protein DUF2269
MLQTLLFFHILAVIGLFTGIVIEVLALVRLQGAATLSDVRAAVLNLPVVGPIMGLSVLLLLAMGISMIYAGGFGWTAPWINVVFAITIVLAILGPAVSGRKADALHALAANAGDGPVTPAVDAARRDRVLNYMAFMSLFELVAALYVMVAKPDVLPAVAAVVVAAIAAAFPAALLLRRSDPAITAQAERA